MTLCLDLNWVEQLLQTSPLGTRPALTSILGNHSFHVSSFEKKIDLFEPLFSWVSFPFILPFIFYQQMLLELLDDDDDDEQEYTTRYFQFNFNVHRLIRTRSCYNLM